MLTTTDRYIRNVTINGECASFTCSFFKGDVDSNIHWEDKDHEYYCVTAEEVISNGCYTTETQSVFLIRNTNASTADFIYDVKCILQQSIPQEFRNDESFKEEFNDFLNQSVYVPTGKYTHSTTSK